MVNILVTGGAGFIGSHIVDSLIQDGHNVAVVDNFSTGSATHVHPGASLFPIDIMDESLGSVFESFRPEVVIHHAAQIDVHVSMHRPKQDGLINIVGSLNVLEQCMAHGVRKIIYASSAAVYGAPISLSIREDHPIQPINAYGISKYTPETYIQLYGQLKGLDYTIFRYANVYGERQSSKGEAGVVSIFIDRLQDGGSTCIYGDGEQTRDFVYVRDVARANKLALTRGSGAVINIGTSRQTTINALYEELRAMASCNRSPVHLDARDGDIRHSCLDYSLATALLGWEPAFSLEEGLRNTYQDRLRLRQGETLTARYSR